MQGLKQYQENDQSLLDGNHRGSHEEDGTGVNNKAVIVGDTQSEDHSQKEHEAFASCRSLNCVFQHRSRS